MKARGLSAAVLLFCAGCTDPAAAPDNPPSVGSIDVPKARASVSSQFVVSGWAADESGVAQVRIYLDDKLVATPKLTVARPDVDRVFPAAQREPHGFSTVVNAGDKTDRCVIRTEVVDQRGALSRVAQVIVVIEP
jgi:hypothetical protein